MAYLKILPINTKSHLNNAIDYVGRADKTLNRELVTCSGCAYETCYNDFQDVKKTFGKENGILAHQMIISYKAGEVSPLIAHDLAQELAERTLTGYQYTICTHVDSKQINTHIIFNSVNSVTGCKFHSNKTSLRNIRAVSDMLCQERGLSIIYKTSGMKGIDKTTYQLASEGKSWKIKLLNDLDSIIGAVTDKESFIKELTSKGYTVKYMDKNITIKKNGEKKAIRVDTLAKQFGTQYTKENIERSFYGLAPKEDIFKTEEAPTLDENKTEFVRVEKTYFQSKPYAPNKRFTKDEELSRMLRIERSLKNTRTVDRFIVRGLFFFLYKNSSQRRREKFDNFKKWKTLQEQSNPLGIVANEKIVTKSRFTITNKNKGEVKFGNISYRELMKAAGENVTLKIDSQKADLMKNARIFYSGIMKPKGDIFITFKKIHEKSVSEILGIDLSQVKTKGAISEERLQFKLMEYKSNKLNVPMCQYKCSLEEVTALDEKNIAFSSIQCKDGSFKVHFLENDLQKVCTTINRNYDTDRKVFDKKNNSRIYAELKEIAKLENDKMLYRVVNEKLLDVLKKSSFKFACFEKEDKFNIAFLEQDLRDYEKILTQLQEQQRAREDEERTRNR